VIATEKVCVIEIEAYKYMDILTKVEAYTCTKSANWRRNEEWRLKWGDDIVWRKTAKFEEGCSKDKVAKMIQRNNEEEWKGIKCSVKLL